MSREYRRISRRGRFFLAGAREMADNERMGLYELVEQARDCWVSRVVVRQDSEDNLARDNALSVAETIRDLADEVVQAASEGNFGPVSAALAVEEIVLSGFQF